MLGDGVAARAADIDVVYLTGYGFPSFRGGPMFYADSVGLREVYDRLAEYHRSLGPRWEPAPLLARLAREGSRLPPVRRRARGGAGFGGLA